jgi:translation initiation factor 3 subunit A
MPVLEDILKKFLSLCTEMRQNRKAKDGLIQYRQIAQNVPNGPESILKVVTSFIGDGEKAVREAEEKAGLGADSVANLQDLEAEETPETMIHSVLTGDLSDTGRADRLSLVLINRVCDHLSSGLLSSVELLTVNCRSSNGVGRDYRSN